MVKKFYMGESKPGSIEESILGIWKEAAQEVDEKKSAAKSAKVFQKAKRDAAVPRGDAPEPRRRGTVPVVKSGPHGVGGSPTGGTLGRGTPGGRGDPQQIQPAKRSGPRGADLSAKPITIRRDTDGRDSSKAGKYARAASAGRKDAKDQPIKVSKGWDDRSKFIDKKKGEIAKSKEKRLAASFSPEEIENFEMIMNESVSTPEIEAVWKAAAENDMSGEKSYEMGTERYLKHTQKITPGQLEEEIAELDALIEELELTEGTWHIAKDMSGLKIMMKKPIKLGNEGDDATEVISPFIGDDQLYDDLIAAGKKNPRGDARPIIQKAMKRLRIKEEVELNEVKKISIEFDFSDARKKAQMQKVIDFFKKNHPNFKLEPKDNILKVDGGGKSLKRISKNIYNMFYVKSVMHEEVELDEVEEGIAGNIVKGVGKSIAKGGKIAGKKFVVDPLKAKGKSLKAKIVGKAKSSLIGKGVGKVKSSIGKVKSGIKKAKEIGAGIKKMAQTGQAYGDEYNPMLDRLEIIEFKLTEYCKVLEEARQLKDPKKEMMVKSKDSGVIVIDKKDFKAYQKKGYFAVEETQREEEVVMEKKKLDKVDKDELKKSFDKRADDGDADIDNDGDEDDSDEFLHKKRKAISKAIDAKESLNLRDTIVKMWTEASSAVNPNDREDLDDGKGATGEGGKKTAAKMKRAEEPKPMVATEDMSVEEAQKQKTLSMKEALAKVWGFEEDWQKGYPKKKKMTPESKNGKTTDTGGKMAEVEIDPELKDKK